MGFGLGSEQPDIVVCFNLGLLDSMAGSGLKLEQPDSVVWFGLGLELSDIVVYLSL